MEFYYNDILKFNDTLEVFQGLLENSKYSNLYNFCGLPPWIKINETNIKQNDTNDVNNKSTQNETNIESVQNKTNNDYNQTEINKTNYLHNFKPNNSTMANLKLKLKKFFNQDNDRDLFIIIGSIIFSIIMLIVLILLIIILYIKRRIRFTKLVEENQKNFSNQLNLSESKK